MNKVQLDIRTGHAQTVDKVLNWLDADGGVKGTSVCDCGCGTGSLAIPVALRGAAVTASDISASMVGEAERRYKGEVATGSAAPATAPVWEAKDLESVSGQYDVVACLDVMIHYPQVRFVLSPAVVRGHAWRGSGIQMHTPSLRSAPKQVHKASSMQACA